MPSASSRFWRQAQGLTLCRAFVSISSTTVRRSISEQTILTTRVGGSASTCSECRRWIADVGFKDSYVKPVVGPDSIMVGVK